MPFSKNIRLKLKNIRLKSENIRLIFFSFKMISYLCNCNQI